MASFKPLLAVLLLTAASCKERRPAPTVENAEPIALPPAWSPPPPAPVITAAPPSPRPVATPAPVQPQARRTAGFDTVVIDPGHGGLDEGTAWYRVREKDMTLAVALRLEKLLRDRNIPCVLTRRTDTYVSIDDRVKIANTHRHSLMLSIHFNASPDPEAAGFSTYYFAQSPSGKFIAQTLQTALDEARATTNRGIKAQNYAVLVRTDASAVLVECGFLSNRAEAHQFTTAAEQQRLAEALARGILRARPVVIEDPPETEMAKCEVYAKHLEEKDHQRRASIARAKPAATPKPAPSPKPAPPRK